MSKVTYADVQRALSQHGAEILEQIPCEPVQLSLPVDGKGPRICVSVLPGDVERVPATVKLKVGRRIVTIPVEALDDYEAVKAQ